MRYNALIKKETKIMDAVKMMSSSEQNKFIAGIVVVVDDTSKVIGVISDGDIRRGLAKGVGLESPVEKIANFNPVVVSSMMSKAQMQKEIIHQAKKRNSRYQKFDKIILVDAEKKFCDMVTLDEIFDEGIEDKIIAIHGLGFVGLTLASVMANNGLLIIGIDTNEKVISKLQEGKPSFFENGLESLLLSLQKTNPIQFASGSDDYEADVHIITVGTPIDSDKKPMLDHVIQVTEMIAKRLKKNNLVVFRSTVPVGTTRNVLIPILEKSGMIAGEDFYLAFAPERTVEGDALEELRTLPQIIGGINQVSYEKTAQLFTKITKTIIEVDSLEAAEMIKLMNNTYRDVVFAFANEVAHICDHFNINAFRLIEAANEGYPRNRIPMPSPGVGGPCLTKDSYLYSNPAGGFRSKPMLGKTSRIINSQGPAYILEKLQMFCKVTDQKFETLKIYLIGLAFKGMPETSDIRDSMSQYLIGLLPDKKNVFVKDFVVPQDAIESMGCRFVENITDGFSGASAVLIMNNHYQNNRFNVVQALDSAKKPLFFFDGWNMFNQNEMERINGVYYATMGYMTNEAALEQALSNNTATQKPITLVGKG